MVKYFNATVEIWEEKSTVNEEGDKILDYVLVDSVRGDVQPHTLTEDEVSLYGINTKKANVKKFFFNGKNKNIKNGNRAVVSSEYTEATDIYTIMSVNAWERHGECLLVPVENE